MPGDQSDAEMASQAFLDQKWAAFRYLFNEMDPVQISELASVLSDDGDDIDPRPLLASLDLLPAGQVLWLARLAFAQILHSITDFKPDPDQL